MCDSFVFYGFNIISFQAEIRVSQGFIFCDIVGIRYVRIKEGVQLLLNVLCHIWSGICRALLALLLWLLCIQIQLIFRARFSLGK